MPLDAKLIRRLQRELDVGAAAGASGPGGASSASGGVRGPRLVDDARRLFRQITRLIDQKVVAAEMDVEAIELACWAMQLPLAQPPGHALPTRMGVVLLRDRAEQAAELLVGGFSSDAPESLLDRTTRLLHETPQRPPVLDEAKLLADAIGLEDYGLSGLLRALVRLAVTGQGLDQLQEAIVKREQYGYFEARLKDGFNFEATRQVARQRLDHARHAAKLLAEELDG